MEAHRLGYVKILKKVIIDSNILMQSIKYGINIKQAVEDGEGHTIIAKSIGKNTEGQVVSEFEFTWTFKAKGMRA